MFQRMKYSLRQKKCSDDYRIKMMPPPPVGEVPAAAADDETGRADMTYALVMLTLFRFRLFIASNMC